MLLASQGRDNIAFLTLLSLFPAIYFSRSQPRYSPRNPHRHYAFGRLATDLSSQRIIPDKCFVPSQPVQYRTPARQIDIRAHDSKLGPRYEKLAHLRFNYSIRHHRLFLSGQRHPRSHASCATVAQQLWQAAESRTLIITPQSGQDGWFRDPGALLLGHQGSRSDWYVSMATSLRLLLLSTAEM